MGIADICGPGPGPGGAMAASQGDWTTVHTDRGMLILSNAEINEYECGGGMGSFPTPNRLCSWPCPEPEPAPEPAAGSGADVVTVVDDAAVGSAADVTATDDAADDVAAATNAFAPAVTAPQTPTL